MTKERVIELISNQKCYETLVNDNTNKDDLNSICNILASFANDNPNYSNFLLDMYEHEAIAIKVEGVDYIYGHYAVQRVDENTVNIINTVLNYEIYRKRNPEQSIQFDGIYRPLKNLKKALLVERVWFEKQTNEQNFPSILRLINKLEILVLYKKQEIKDNNIYVALTPISIPAFNNDLNLIRTKELHDLIKDELCTNENGSIVLLNQNNSEKIEDAIKDDPGYTDYGKITYKYHCLKENKKALSTDEEYMEVLRAIDIVNSTNVWRYDKKSDHQKMTRIRNYICDSNTKFMDRVSVGDLKIVNGIREASIIGDIDGEDENQGEHSFASKVCKYFDEYIYESNSQIDKKNAYKNKYYIDDYYIRAMLPYYLHYYCCLTDDTMVPSRWSK